MNQFPKYGDMDGLHKSNEVLQCAVVVTEKIHGTNYRLSYSEKNGGVLIGTRNNFAYKDGQRTTYDGYNMTEWTLANVDFEKLKKYDSYTFHGEFFGSNIQKGIFYGDKKDVRIFDVRDPEENFLDWEEVERICADVGLKTVVVLMKGMVSVDDLNKMREINSQTAIENGVTLEKNTHEGVVIKPLKMRLDRHGSWMRAKYKSDKFAEQTKGLKPKVINPEEMAALETIREFADSVTTHGRMFTIIEHLTREGNTEVKISRTGEFLREFVADVMKEYPEVYEKLDKKQTNTYNKIISQSASALWKKYLEEM